MAGKHIGGDTAQAALLGDLINTPWLVRHAFSPKNDKAYAEGRRGLSNPHPAGTEASIAFNAGTTAAAVPGTVWETATLGAG